MVSSSLVVVEIFASGFSLYGKKSPLWAPRPFYGLWIWCLSYVEFPKWILKCSFAMKYKIAGMSDWLGIRFDWGFRNYYVWWNTRVDIALNQPWDGSVCHCQSVSQSINQSINQSVDWSSVDQSIKRSISQSVSQLIKQSVIQSVHQSIIQSSNQSVTPKWCPLPVFGW